MQFGSLAVDNKQGQSRSDDLFQRYRDLTFPRWQTLCALYRLTKQQEQ